MDPLFGFGQKVIVKPCAGPEIEGCILVGDCKNSSKLIVTGKKV